MPAYRFWAGEEDINSCSIGVEIINRGHDWGYPDFPLRQIAAVIALCRGIMLRRNIPSHRVLAHSDVAPARKKDPGEKFPWHSLANSGVGHWVQPAPIVRGEVAQARQRSATTSPTCRRRWPDTATASRSTASIDGATMEVVAAFQRHFRPARVDGVADHSTMATLHALLSSFAGGGGERGDEIGSAAAARPPHPALMGESDAKARSLRIGVRGSSARPAT